MSRAALQRRLRLRYLEAHRALGGNAAGATLQLHRAMTDALLQRPSDILCNAPVQEFVTAFRWQLHGSPNEQVLTPESLAELLPLTIDASGSGSYFTSADVADYLARGTILPAVLETTDELITVNADLLWHFTQHVECATHAEQDRLRRRLQSIKVLDPTCGTGAFLLASLRLLFVLRRQLIADESPAQALCAIVRDNLYGVDQQADASAICALRLTLEMARLAGEVVAEPITNLHVGDVLPGRPDTCAVEALSARGFDVILANPPYVRVQNADCATDFETRGCGDLSALIVEQCYRWTQPGARLGLLLPISHFVTAGFAALQRLTWRSLDRFWVAFFANRPAQLFDGAQKRLALVLGRRGTTPSPRIYTTGYLRWQRQERTQLLQRLRFTPTSGMRVLPTTLEKIGSELESRLLERLLRHARLEAGIVAGSPFVLYYTRKFSYFLEFLDFVPRRVVRRTGQLQPPSELKTLCFTSQEALKATIAALSSSTFFWFWNVIADGRNVNRRDLLAFPFNPEALTPLLRWRLAILGHNYLELLRSTKWLMRKGELEIECFAPGTLKPLLDEIDGVLAELYELDGTELAFIRDYDSVYRVPMASS